MPSDPAPASESVVARLKTSEASARRIVDVIAESFDPLEAVAAAYEIEAEKWVVDIHFGRTPNEAAVRGLVALAAGPEPANALIFETTAPKDWVKASLEGLSPVEAGRFFVHGAHDRGRVQPNRLAIEIEAALAFGTGHHGTTRGCLLALDRIVKAHRPRTILDVGTGTGLLAIAAARTLRRPVLASDIDPQARRIAHENARLNHAGPALTVVQAAGLGARIFRDRGRFDLIFANILLGPLLRLAVPIGRLAAPGGRVVLSGLLPPQANTVLAAYRPQGLPLERRILLDGWVTLVMRRT